MMNLNEYIEESILDDEEVVDKKSEKLMYVEEYMKKLRKKSPKDTDMMNNELKNSDLVLAVYKGRPTIGVVINVDRGCVEVCFDTYLKGKTLLGTYDVLKINDTIVKELLKL